MYTTKSTIKNPKTNKRIIRPASAAPGIILLVILLLLPACTVNPVTGKRELSLISEKAEIEIGRQVDQDIRRQYGIYENPALHDYVNNVALNLLPYVHRPNLTYHFAVLDTPVVNAFAAPGGYIYVTRGILALMNSEAELAVVLGHELGHVTARHSVRKMSGLLLLNLGLAVGSLLSEDIAKVAGFASLGIQVLFLKFSRDDEYQADALGLEYARKGGYRPREMMTFFSSLQKMSEKGGGHRLPTFLSTHPLTANRIKRVGEQVSPADDNLPVRQDNYMKQINGMVFGTDPRQGYAEAGAFYHPDLAFSFRIPDGWELQNTPQQVYLAAADGEAALVLRVSESSGNLKDHLKENLAGLNQPVLLNERQLNINGLNSLQHFYQVAEQNSNLDLQITAIRKEKMIYSFLAVTPQGAFQKHEKSLSAMISSFSPLRDRGHLQRRPLRLVTTRAPGGRSLESIFEQSGIPRTVWPHLADLNGIDPKSVPASNSWVKLAR